MTCHCGLGRKTRSEEVVCMGESAGVGDGDCLSKLGVDQSESCCLSRTSAIPRKPSKTQRSALMVKVLS